MNPSFPVMQVLHLDRLLVISFGGNKMANSVVLKGNPYGISVIITEAEDYNEIKRKVIEKFVSSENFFKGATICISFEGDQLKDEYQLDLLNAIIDNTNLDIGCLIDKAEDSVAYYKDILNAMEEEQKPKDDYHDFTFIIRNGLKANEVIEKKTGVLIYGDVAAGASVVSESDVTVLGNVYGEIKAGMPDNKNCVVYALDLEACNLCIGGITETLDDKNNKSFFKKRKKKTRELIKAYVVEDKICFEEV